MASNWNRVLPIAFLLCAAALHAQSAPLPAGTSAPDADSRQADPVSLSISHAEENISSGAYAKALPFLSEVLAAADATGPQRGRALYDRGYIEEAQHQAAAAEADFRKAIVADPKQFESHAALGQLLARREQWTDARHELELAARLQPAGGKHPRAVANVDRMLAHVDAQLHDDPAASDALLAALRLTPEETEDTLLAAQLAEDQKNDAGAAQEYRKVLAKDPKSIAAAEGLARSLIHEKKYSDALAVLKPALQQEPNNPVLLAESATALAGEGKNQDSIAQLATLHRQNPNQPAVTRMLADLYRGAGQSAEAEPLYRQLLAADPRNPGLLTAAAENLMQERKWLQAEKTFQQSLALKTEQPDAWSGLAFAAFENGQYALTLTALDHRNQSLPEAPGTLFLRGSSLDHLHRTKEALPYYRKFLSAAHGTFPEEESQVRQRLAELHK